MKNLKNTKNLAIILILTILCTILIKSVQDRVNTKTTVPLEKIRVQAGWIINGEFAGICSAMLNGYYKAENLEVELIPGGPSGASFILATNAIAQDPTLTIGIEGDMVPLIRSRSKLAQVEQVRAKAFAALWSPNPYGFIVRKDSEINSIADLTKLKPDGTKYKIGVTADSVIQNAIANAYNISVKDMDIVIVGFDSTPFLTGQVDVMAGFWTTLVYDANKAGIPNNFISSDQIPGFKQPALIAEATEYTLSTKQDVLIRWMNATIKGIKFVIQNPEIAAKHIRNESCGGPILNEEQELWLIKNSIELYQDKIGWIDKNQISDFSRTYHSLGQIESIPRIDDIVDYRILNEIYK